MMNRKKIFFPRLDKNTKLLDFYYFIQVEQFYS